MYHIQIEFACPHASDGIQIHSRETRPTRCAAILVYCSVRDWIRFCYVIGLKKSRFTVHTLSEFGEMFRYCLSKTAQFLGD